MVRKQARRDNSNFNQRVQPRRFSREVTKQDSAELLAIGRNSVREILRFSPERVERVYISGGAPEEILALCDELQIEQIRLNAHELTARAKTEAHQGVLAELKPRRAVLLDDFLKLAKEKPHSLLIALDNIQDPHNLGAILRAAECFAADGVIWSKNRGVSLTPTVSKVSAGASEIVSCLQVANLADSLQKLSDAGFWVVAASVREGSENLDKFKFPEHCILVLGSEGDGISQLIEKRASYRVYIPMLGRIDSLNVSQSAAVMLASYRRIHQKESA